MRNTLFFLFIFLSFHQIQAQSRAFVDSLSADTANKVLVYREGCKGCRTINPCEKFTNSLSNYVFWKNMEGYHIKHFTSCGSSPVYTFQEWKERPFEWIASNRVALDTTQIKYPAFYDEKSDKWGEVVQTHYFFYIVEFPSYDIKKYNIRDYAFEKPERNNGFRKSPRIEYRENKARYKHNQRSVIKQLIDMLNKKLKELWKKELKIIVNKSE